MTSPDNLQDRASAHAAQPLRVGLIGYGAIGATAGEALLADQVAGCRLAGVVSRVPVPDAPMCTFEALVEGSDIIVEAAGQPALAAYGPQIVRRGVDLLLVSVGALVDPDLRGELAAGPGRAEVSSGAIGGFDALRAAHRAGGLDEVELVTSKLPTSLMQPWMPADLQARLERGEERLEVFNGTAGEAVERFPQSVNVAATLALATLGFERTRVRVIAHPACTLNEHTITATGAVGDYRLRFRNRPSPDNPRTSALTALAVLRRLEDRACRLVIGV